jgi:uncharacterized phage protein gp47/JayE
MALPQVTDAFYPTPEEVLAIALTNVRYAYDTEGVEVNVTEGSELYERFKVFSDLVSIAIANNELALADVSPLEATGDALTELAGMYGVWARPASSAAGTVIVGVVGAAVTIPNDYVCTSPFGIQFDTISAFTVGDGEGVTIQAISGGANTELEEGDIVTWDSAAIGTLDQTAVVGVGGITGGHDADTEEDVRRRLLQRLRDPSIGGNAAFVASVAEGASAGVERGFVHMAARGPSSYDVAITRDAGDRVLSTAIVNLVASTILGEMPGSADLNVTSVLAEEVDVIINMELPLPVNAGGAGGGWRDATPVPSTSEVAADTYGEITSVQVDANRIIVNNSSADIPLAGNRIGIWDPDEEVMNEFTIRTVTGATGAYTLTLDGSVGFVEAGMFISAGAINLAQYASEFLAAMRALGPGEKTENIDKLPRALRYPSADIEFPQNLTSIQLTAVSNVHPEVLNMEYELDKALVAGTGDVAGGGTGTFEEIKSPTVATIETDPPSILVLRNLSFRRKV